MSWLEELLLSQPGWESQFAMLPDAAMADEARNVAARRVAGTRTPPAAVPGGDVAVLDPESAQAAEAARLAAALRTGGRRGPGMLSPLLDAPTVAPEVVAAPAAPVTALTPNLPASAGFPKVPQEIFNEQAEVEAASKAAAARVAGRRGPQPMQAQAPISGGLLGLQGTMLAAGPGADDLGAGAGIGAGGEPPARPPATNDPLSGEPQLFQDGVPVPRPDPRKFDPGAPSAPMSLAPTDMSSSARPGAPAGVAAPGAPVASPGAAPAPMGAPAVGGGFDLGGLLGKILNPANAPMLMAMGAGFSGAPSLGTGMSRGFGAAAPHAALLRKEQVTKETQGELYRSLVGRGVPAQEALAATRSPDLMKALVSKYFETKPAQVVNGHMVREMPDGTIRQLADFSDPAKGIKEGYRPVDPKDPAKGWTFVPGGPADPAVIERTNEARQKDRHLNPNDIAKLTEEGGKFQKVAGFASTFKPEFAGFVSDTVGDVVNTVGRNMPGASPAMRDRSAWWQEYERYRNEVRHGLFGASLTKNEQKAFQAADITPGMQPEVIQRNLAKQQDISRAALKRKADALANSGYDRPAVNSAFGLDTEAMDAPAATPPAAPAIKPGAPMKTKTGISWSIE